MRNSGRTTRVIDEAVQTLFIDGKVTLTDHYFGTYADDPYEQARLNVKATRYAFRTLARRLSNEHGGPENFVFDMKRFTVTLERQRA